MDEAITLQEAKKAAKIWDKASTKLAKIQAEKREKITPITKKYEALESTESDKMKGAIEVLEKFANQERDNLFDGDKKSTGFEGLKIGFRTGRPSLQIADEETAITFFKEWYPEYTLEKVSLDKNGIVANLAIIDEDDLEQAGITIKQEEKFYVKE